MMRLPIVIRATWDASLHRTYLSVRNHRSLIRARLYQGKNQSHARSG
jgi:hypothetical protein